MAKNVLEICIGTPCYLMGAAELLESAENFDNKLKEKLEIKTSNCIEDCCSQAPVVRFNGQIYQNITPEKLNKIISENITEE